MFRRITTPITREWLDALAAQVQVTEFGTNNPINVTDRERYELVLEHLMESIRDAGYSFRDGGCLPVSVVELVKTECDRCGVSHEDARLYEHETGEWYCCKCCDHATTAEIGTVAGCECDACECHRSAAGDPLMVLIDENGISERAHAEINYEDE
jgi:hypothetical protein